LIENSQLLANQLTQTALRRGDTWFLADIGGKAGRRQIKPCAAWVFS
jgi:hypothetical protein